MKRWLTVQQMAMHIAELDKSTEYRELNISHCNKIAKNIKNMYAEGGKEMVVKNIRDSLPNYSGVNPTGLTMHQKDTVEKIVKTMFKNHWWPWSRIRNNMRRLTK